MLSLFLAAAAIQAHAAHGAHQPQGMARPHSMQCAAVTQAQAEALFNQFDAAWATKNPDRVTDLFARDAVLLPTVSNTPRTDRAGIRDYFVTFLKNSPKGSIDTSALRIGCNSIARMGTWTVALTDAKTRARTNVKARYTFIYALEDGQWKIAHLHSSLMPEPAKTAGK